MAKKIEYIFPKEDGVALVDGIPRIVDRDAYISMMEQKRRDMQFFGAHRKELLEKYLGQWVAVHKEQVVAVADTWEGLLEKVDALGIHRTHMEPKFIREKPLRFISSVFRSSR